MGGAEAKNPTTVLFLHKYQEANRGVIRCERPRGTHLISLPYRNKGAGLGWGQAGRANPPQLRIEADGGGLIVAALLLGPRALPAGSVAPKGLNVSPKLPKAHGPTLPQGNA